MNWPLIPLLPKDVDELFKKIYFKYETADQSHRFNDICFTAQ